MNGETVAILSKSSGKYLDGRAESGQEVLMTARDPVGDLYLNWNIVQLENGLVAVRSVSSGVYLDGRHEPNINVLVTDGNPAESAYFQWRLIPTGEDDWFVLQSVSSNSFLDGRGAEENALVTDRPW